MYTYVYTYYISSCHTKYHITLLLSQRDHSCCYARDYERVTMNLDCYRYRLVASTHLHIIISQFNLYNRTHTYIFN